VNSVRVKGPVPSAEVDHAPALMALQQVQE
jgi:hypothetical protein